MILGEEKVLRLISMLRRLRKADALLLPPVLVVVLLGGLLEEND